MKRSLLFIMAVILISCHGSNKASYRATDMSGGLLRDVISDWPDNKKEAAAEMIGKYGLPDEVSYFMLVWHNNGPWARTILSRDDKPHEYPVPHMDFLEQTIKYNVVPGRYDLLVRYDGNVTVDRAKGTLSVRCDREELNFLALNLANDIISGKKTAEEASDQFAWAATRFKQGSSHPYLQGIQFDITAEGK